MKEKLLICMKKLKVPTIWAFFVVFALVLVAQRVYLIRLEERMLENNEFITSLRDQNNEIERDIARIVETKELERIASMDFGLRSAALNEVFVLAEPRVGDETIEAFSFNDFLAKARRRIDGLVVGTFKFDNKEIGGSL